MKRLNDHRHVHNQCARARGCVHVFDDEISPMMATKACKFASVRRSVNISSVYQGIKVWYASMLNARQRH